MSLRGREGDRSYGKLVEIVAGLIAIGAGISLITTHAAESNSLFNPLLHGIGWYFIARGIWMIRQAGRQEDVVDRLDKLIDATRRHKD